MSPLDCVLRESTCDNAVYQKSPDCLPEFEAYSTCVAEASELY